MSLAMGSWGGKLLGSMVHKLRCPDKELNALTRLCISNCGCPDCGGSARDTALEGYGSALSSSKDLNHDLILIFKRYWRPLAFLLLCLVAASTQHIVRY